MTSRSLLRGWSISIIVGAEQFSFTDEDLLASPELSTELRRSAPPELRNDIDGSLQLVLRRSTLTEALVILLATTAHSAQIVASAPLRFWGRVTQIREQQRVIELHAEWAWPRENQFLCRNTVLLLPQISPRWLPQLFGRRQYLSTPLFESRPCTLAETLSPGDELLILDRPMNLSEFGGIQINDEMLVYTEVSENGLELVLENPVTLPHEKGSRVIPIPDGNVFRWCLADHEATPLAIRLNDAFGEIADGIDVTVDDFFGRDATLAEAAILPLAIRHAPSTSIRMAGAQSSLWEVDDIASTALFPSRAFGEREDGRVAGFTEFQNLIEVTFYDDFRRSRNRFDKLIGAELALECTTPNVWPAFAQLNIQVRSHSAVLNRSINAATGEHPTSGFAWIVIDLTSIIESVGIDAFFLDDENPPELSIAYVVPPDSDPILVQVRRVHFRQTILRATMVQPVTKLWIDAEGRHCRADGTANPADVIETLLFDPDFCSIDDSVRDDDAFSDFAAEMDFHTVSLAAVYTDSTRISEALSRALGESGSSLLATADGIAIAPARLRAEITPPPVETDRIARHDRVATLTPPATTTGPIIWRWLVSGAERIIALSSEEHSAWRREEEILWLSGDTPALAGSLTIPPTAEASEVCRVTIGDGWPQLTMRRR